MSTGRKLPCQFFMLGTCRFTDDKDCSYSHDQSICVPGSIKVQCLHYQNGYCRSGKMCLNLHDRDTRDQALTAPNPSPPKRHAPVITEQQKPLALFGSQESQKEKKDQLPPGFVVLKKRTTSSDNSNKQSTDSTTTGEQQKQESQNGYHRTLETEENIYFFGDMPSESAPRKAYVEAPDWTKVANQSRSAQESDEYQEFLMKQQMMQMQFLAQQQTASQQYDSVCKFFLQGSCRFGDRCKFSHTLPLFDAESELWKFERSASSDLECGICLENVMSAGDGRFGLLTGCEHAFCLKCIKNWRSSDISAKDDSKELVRRCPLCREPSFFVVPCDRMVRDPSRKAALIEEYREGMKKIHCKHFDHGNGTCPFGTSCFYKHVYPDGREQTIADLRTYQDSEGKMKVDATSRLNSYFDHALNLHNSRNS